MQVLESSGVRNPVVKFARDNGILVTKMNIMGRRGMPDDVFWVKGGKPLIIEFKAPGKEPRRLQQITIDYLKRLDYDVQTCDDPATGIRILTDRLGTAFIPKTRGKVVTGTRRGRIVPGPRTGKDKHNARRLKDT